MILISVAVITITIIPIYTGTHTIPGIGDCQYTLAIHGYIHTGIITGDTVMVIPTGTDGVPITITGIHITATAHIIHLTGQAITTGTGTDITATIIIPTIITITVTIELTITITVIVRPALQTEIPGHTAALMGDTVKIQTLPKNMKKPFCLPTKNYPILHLTAAFQIQEQRQ